ncbi:hypothetical protein DRJ48_01515 [Candidatus Woesearchaeota archaeon]|nr:deoxynucleoside kinase [Candidatus Woesearchaeota archaeon]RLE43201.1 MAG: hypothetical protein DRJ48_01515 [Candidatus Woesearchaeota archaeon]
MVWIAISGIDGAGKTTLLDFLHKHIRELGDVKRFKHPHFDWLREMLSLVGEDPYTDLLLFSSEIRCEMHLIREWTKKYKYLISQRCWLDHFPYRLTQGFSIEETYKLLSPSSFLVPDIVVYLRCDYKTAYNRIKGKRGDKYETLSFLRMLEKNFDYVINEVEHKRLLPEFNATKILRIDSSGSIENTKSLLLEGLREYGLI